MLAKKLLGPSLRKGADATGIKQEGRKIVNAKNWRRLLSCVLAAAIAASYLCTSAFAVETRGLEYGQTADDIGPVRIEIKNEAGQWEWVNIYNEQGVAEWVETVTEQGKLEWVKAQDAQSEDELRQRIADKKASLEQQYGIKIVMLNATSDDYVPNLGAGDHEYLAKRDNSPAYQLRNLFRLEDAIQAVPSQLYAAARAKLAAQGKTLTIHLKPADASGYAGLYDPQTDTMLLVNIDRESFAHEYGHMLHLEMLNAQYGAGALENDWTALNQGVAYGDYEEKTFLTAYASTSYHEDFAESVRGLLAASQEVQSLSAQVPNCAVINKIIFLRQLLCDTFSLDEAIFPDIDSSQSGGLGASEWAVSGIQRYLELFPYGSLASATGPFEPGYQSGATREAFAIGAYGVANAVWADEHNDDARAFDYWFEVYPQYTRDQFGELNPFTDLIFDGEAYNYTNETIIKLYLMGVLSGRSATTFHADGQITRQEAAVMLCRLCTELGYQFPENVGHTFNDEDQIADWAKESVEAVSAAGIMSGIGNNEFGPQQVYTYEQSALTMVRIYDLLSKR